jgi:hypothetical protein
MTRLPRAAALQVGEFAVGVTVSYVAVVATYALTTAVWPALLVTLALVVVGITAEVRWGPKATGLLAGLVPTALVAVALVAALSAFVYQLD